MKQSLNGLIELIFSNKLISRAAGSVLRDSARVRRNQPAVAHPRGDQPRSRVHSAGDLVAGPRRWVARRHGDRLHLLANACSKAASHTGSAARGSRRRASRGDGSARAHPARLRVIHSAIHTGDSYTGVIVLTKADTVGDAGSPDRSRLSATSWS